MNQNWQFYKDIKQISVYQQGNGLGAGSKEKWNFFELMQVFGTRQRWLLYITDVLNAMNGKFRVRYILPQFQKMRVY